MVAILERLTQAQERQEIQLQRQAQDNATAFAQIQARQDEFQRQQAATQQQYLELLRHLVTVGVPLPPSVLTPALQSSGLQSQGPQPSFQFASP
jgi:glutamate-1-semialdehyde aminotransferase